MLLSCYFLGTTHAKKKVRTFKNKYKFKLCQNFSCLKYYKKLMKINFKELQRNARTTEISFGNPIYFQRTGHVLKNNLAFV